MPTIEKVIELPDNWIKPETTLAPLFERNSDPMWFTLMNYVCKALLAVGNDQSVLISYRDQAMSDTPRHLLQVSMVFMGEMELEHDGPTLL